MEEIPVLGETPSNNGGGTPSNDALMEEDTPADQAVAEDNVPTDHPTGQPIPQRAASPDKAPSTTPRTGSVVGGKRARDDSEGPQHSSAPRREGLRQRQPVQYAVESGPVSKKPRKGVNAFDDSCDAPVSSRHPKASSLIPDDSPVFSLLTNSEQDRLFAYSHMQTEYDLAMFCAHDKALTCNGFSVVRDVIPETAPRGQTLPITRRDADKLFLHYEKAAKVATWKCCADGPKMNDSIHNEDVRQDQRLRHQATNEGLEHLRVSHPEVYKLKLRLDVSAAILFDDFGIRTKPTAKYLIPRTGGRMLVTYPGCRPQKPHTDFKPRFGSSRGKVVTSPNPSYFAIFTAKNEATVLVWVASHQLYARLSGLAERAGQTSTDPNDSAAEDSPSVASQKQANKDLMRTIKPMRVTIPPYSAFIARGDLVHAGDSSSPKGKSVELRMHIHCTSDKDALKNEIYALDFGELTQSEEDEEESSRSDEDNFDSSSNIGTDSGEE
jgi:hypothetical protein